MPRVALAIMPNCTLEKLDCFIETALPARHSTVKRLKVAERHIIVGLAQYSFRCLRNANCVFPLALLEQDPALEHLHYCGHARMPQLQRQVSSLPGVDQRFVILASSAQTAPLPEINNGQQKGIVQLVAQAEHKIKMTDRRF